MPQLVSETQSGCFNLLLDVLGNVLSAHISRTQHFDSSCCIKFYVYYVSRGYLLAFHYALCIVRPNQNSFAILRTQVDSSTQLRSLRTMTRHNTQHFHW
jgi:hypothetical protein